MTKETSCCQPILAKYAEKTGLQQEFPSVCIGATESFGSKLPRWAIFITMGNHVYYARYLELREVARGEFFRSLGTSFLYWQEQGTIFPVVECHLRYKLPARYDEVLKIEVWPMLAERARLNFGYRILNKSDMIVMEAETHHVCTGLDEKPKRLPEELREKLGRVE